MYSTVTLPFSTYGLKTNPPFAAAYSTSVLSFSLTGSSWLEIKSARSLPSHPNSASIVTILAALLAITAGILRGITFSLAQGGTSQYMSFHSFKASVILDEIVISTPNICFISCFVIMRCHTSLTA